MFRLKTPCYSGFLFLLMAAATAAEPIEGELYSNVDRPLTIELVREAKKTLDIEIYTLTDPVLMLEMGRAAERGVKIRIVKDPKPVGGETCRWFPKVPGKLPAKAETKDTTALGVDCSATDELIAAIFRNGGEIVPFDKATQCGALGVIIPNCFEHGKIMLIDDLTAWMSTGNMDATNLCLPDEPTLKCNRDFSWKITDRNLVDSLKKVFEHDFTNSPEDLGEIIRDGKVDPRLTVSPFARTALTDFIDSATTTLDIANQYLKDPGLNEAIVRAANRGVKVRVEFASFCAFGTPSAGDRGRNTALYSRFDEAGITSRAFTSSISIGGRPGYLHAKYIVVDGSAGWLGSVNGSTTAVDLNREFGVFFSNEEAIALLQTSFENDFSDIGSESWQESLVCLKDYPNPAANPGSI